MKSMISRKMIMHGNKFRFPHFATSNRVSELQKYPSIVTQSCRTVSKRSSRSSDVFDSRRGT